MEGCIRIIPVITFRHPRFHWSTRKQCLAKDETSLMHTLSKSVIFNLEAVFTSLSTSSFALIPQLPFTRNKFIIATSRYTSSSKSQLGFLNHGIKQNCFNFINKKAYKIQLQSLDVRDYIDSKKPCLAQLIMLVIEIVLSAKLKNIIL